MQENTIPIHAAALFYTSQWQCFDNFSAFAVNWNERLWPTVEHAYQAAKFDDDRIINAIWKATSPNEAKNLGGSHNVVHAVRPDWQDVKLAVMEEILRAKLAQHEHVQRRLRQSIGMILVENSPTDAFWGRGPRWGGENHLGKIWMKLRDEMFQPVSQ